VIAVLNWLLNHWFLIFLLSAFGFFEGVRDFFIGIAEAVGGVFDGRHQRELERIRAQHPAPSPALSGTPLPGPCVHRRVKQVRDRRDELVGWLCIGCDRQLPADWAVAEEDLP
jgi:hypothetical protein